MPRIAVLTNTCTMYEIGGVSRDSFLTPIGYSEFKDIQNRAGHQSLIFNTKLTVKGFLPVPTETAKIRRKLRDLGFNKVHTYMGGHGSKVDTWIKDCNSF